MTLPKVTDISYKDLVINMDVSRKSKTANREDDKLLTMIMIMGTGGFATSQSHLAWQTQSCWA